MLGIGRIALGCHNEPGPGREAEGHHDCQPGRGSPGGTAVWHFILSELNRIVSALNGAWFVVIGLVVWAWAYVFLTRVITPDSIGDLMTLIAAVLPFFSILIAGGVAGVSFFITPQHWFQGAVFAVIFGAALWVTIVQIRDSEIRKALGKQRVRSLRYWKTIGLICWGSLGAILVFASELGLVFGGWQLIQGPWVWGAVSAGSAAVISILGAVPDTTKNPIRKCVKALKGDDTAPDPSKGPIRQFAGALKDNGTDRSVQFMKRLLKESERDQTSEPAGQTMTV